MFKTHDELIAAVSPDQRAALLKLRKQIKAAAPGADECINYGIAAYRVNGKAIAGYAAGKGHCSYFPMDGGTVAAFKKELAGFETSKGAIRFQPGNPIPAALVRKLVKARIAAVQDGVTRTDPKVDALLAKLRHPLKRELELLRKDILAISKGVREELKWNSPSFKLTDHFAAINTRGNGLLLVLHTGAKKKAGLGPKVSDPKGLLEWRSKDRALVQFADAAELKAKRAAVKTILRQWVKQV